MKLYQDREWLYQKYIVEELSEHRVAKLCLTSQATIGRWLNKYDISIRSIKGRTPWNKNIPRSEETKNKIRNALKGKKLSKMAKIKISKGNKGKVFSIEHRKKLSENNVFRRLHFVGKDNGNWKGGKTSLSQRIYSIIKSSSWRKEIFKRDKFTCQVCGDNKGGNLNSHHIISFSKILQYYEITTIKEALECKLLWNINNGITLCEKCHDKIHSKEFKKWAYFFIRAIMYDKTKILKFNENIINGLFTMGYSGDSEESYALTRG